MRRGEHDLFQPDDDLDPWPGPRGRWWSNAGLVGAVIGAVVTGLIWAVVSNVGGGTGRESVASTSPVAAHATRAAAAGGCQAVYAAQVAPLNAASTALDQWEVHVGAMNKLVTGAITLQQATAFWNQTRVDAQRNLDRFQAALTAYRAGDARCPAARLTHRPPPAAGSCPAAVRARGQQLRAATRALRTWAKHVRAMEMLRMGQMTPAQATSMWLAAWHSGVRQLAVYTQRATAADGQHC